MKDFILVLDTYGLIYKSYYAFYRNPLVTREGKNVSSVYGVFNSLLQLIEKYNPSVILATLDSIGPTFRHEKYPEYKANREKTPDDLHEQIPIIENILQAMKVQTLRSNGFEADDIIATIANETKKQKKEIYIFSTDKDLLQLIDDSVFLVRSDKMSNLKIFKTEDIELEWGVRSEQILDLLSLTGDSADNVKGVEGIGIKTAQKILNNYNSVDELFSKIDEDKVLTKNVKEKLINGRKSFEQAKDLIKLEKNVPIEFSLSKTNFDFASAAKKLADAQIPSLAKKFEKLSGKKVLDKASQVDASETSKAKTITTEKKPATAKKKSSPKIILSPLQKIAMSEKNNFAINANVELISKASELEKIFAKNKDKNFLAFYFQIDDETKPITEQGLASLAFSFDKNQVYIIENVAKAKLENEELNLFEEKTDVEILKVLTKFFAETQATLLIHDAKPSLQVLKHLSLIKNYNIKIFDTSLAAWVLQSSLNNYLIETIARFVYNFKFIEYKKISKGKKSFYEIEKKTAREYLTQNVLLTFNFYELFSKSLKENELEKIYNDIELKLLPILCKMEEHGIYLSVKELNDFSASIDNEIKKLEKAIYEFAGYEFNIASPKQLQVVLFDELKLKPLKKIKTGFSTDDATLESLINDHPIIFLIVNYRKLTKLQSTYAVALPKLVDENNFIHTTFLQTGTATGRLSSKDPNLQNIPIRDEIGRKIRHAFYATKGRVLLTADYSQIELVVLAHLSQDKALCEAFTSGLDVHAKTASLIFHTSVENVSSEMRSIAKVINFGVIYGMSAFRLANELKIPRKTASEFIEHYFKNYNGVTKFLESMKVFAEENGYVETITGRRRYIPNINNKNKTVKNAAERIAINSPIQGSASDIVKLAMIEMDKKISEQKLDANLLLQVHDELIFSCNESEQDKLKALVKETLESVIKLSVPLRVSIEVGKSWGDFH
ncbi:MAG: DNA polymerase I [Treponemataceae bacterium]